MKEAIRRLDERATGGRARRWWLRNAVLGAQWGEFTAFVESVPDGSLVLDLGAGEAELRARLPRARYLALDRGIGHAGWDYGALDVVADAAAVPLRERTVDVVLCKQVLEHVAEPVRLLEEVRRVLRPGGTVVLSTNQSWPQHQKPHDFFRFTSFGLRYCFERAGLRVEKMEPMGGVFSAALFHVSQTFSPHLWARSRGGQRIAAALLRPLGWLMRALMPIVTALDRRDPTKDNTLGWYVVARAP